MSAAEFAYAPHSRPLSSSIAGHNRRAMWGDFPFKITTDSLQVLLRSAGNLGRISLRALVPAGVDKGQKFVTP